MTIIDFATRYPEAVLLKGISSEEVAEALVDVYSRVGIPGEVLTDLGNQFITEIMKQVSKFLSIKLISMPYHQISNGMVERLNGTIKKMLRRMCPEQPREYLSALFSPLEKLHMIVLGFSI